MVDGFTISYSTGRRTILQNAAPIGYSPTVSNGTGTLSNSTSLTGIGLSQNRVAILTNFTLVGYTTTVSIPRNTRLMDLSAFVGYTLTGSNLQKASIQHAVPNGLAGVSFILSDRQIITQRPGMQGISFVLSDRQIITQRPGIQGISLVLSDQQPFNFQYGFSAITIDGATNEQWFQPSLGMEAVDIEIDLRAPKGYIIRK